MRSTDAGPFVAGYGHFLRVADSLQWDQQAVDLSVDCEQWPGLDEPSRRRLLGLIAGFAVAEAAVAVSLDPFEAASPNEPVAECFHAQAGDEDRHARFFDRVAAEVAAVAGDDASGRRAALRPLISPTFIDLFESRLPRTARELAAGRAGLAGAVALYHMVLEGVVLLAGQRALLAALDGLPDRLPGLRTGVELVLRDERWHVGFGVRCLQDAGLTQAETETLFADGEAAASAWGELVSPAAIREAALLHRRRLRAAGLARREVSPC
jgi:ribonucleoside-diphosphate reductase beta chain